MCISVAQAAQQCPSIAGKTGVLFGGDLATTKALQPCYQDFVAISKYDAAPLLKCLAQQIDANEVGFVVAGHSSGAAYAERLVQAVQDKSKVRLVLLEGFGSPKNQKGVQTSCWYAKNGSLSGFNAPSMLNPKVCPGGAHASEAAWCKTKVCLHVSLVNLNTPANLSPATVAKEALQNCQGNRDWIDKL